MRLTFKLTLGILIGVAITLLVNLATRTGREMDVLVADTKKDHLVLARALAVDVAEEWRDRGPEAAFLLVVKMNAERADIDIRAVPVTAIPSDVTPALSSGSPMQAVVSDSVITWLPLMQRGHIMAALRLEESLLPARSYVRSTMVRTAITSAVGLSTSAAIAWLFGFVLIGRPVRALVAKARRVGAGDLDGPLAANRSDELGELAAELNAMCDRLRVARQDIERATEQRIAAVEQLRHADRLSTAGLLSAGIAHELGTPLNIVAGRARIIAEESEQQPPAAAVNNALIIEEQCKRMERIVRQLLDFTRARHGARMPTDLAALARGTRDMLASLAQKRRIEIAVDVVGADGAGEVRALVDPAQVQQALTNLVVNALHASGADSEVRLVVSGPSASTHASVAVVDHGSGMEDATVQKLFTPFFTTKDVGEGTGLGLAVAWGLVQENGGRIDVASEKGKGSVFTIRFDTETSDGGTERDAA